MEVPNISKKKKQSKLYVYPVIFFLLLPVVLIPGCTDNNPYKDDKLQGISVTLDLNSTEVETINFTEVEKGLQSKGYVFKFRSNETITPDLLYWVYLPYNGPYMEFLVLIHYDNSTNPHISWVNVSYTPTITFKKEKLPSKKKFIQETTNEIAEISGLTLDWEDAPWKIEYFS